MDLCFQEEITFCKSVTWFTSYNTSLDTEEFIRFFKHPVHPEHLRMVKKNSTYNFKEKQYNYNPGKFFEDEQLFQPVDKASTSKC